jgi:putative peptidoglycan lipid II flippase
VSDDASTNLEALRSLSHKKRPAALIHKMLSGAFLLSLGTMTSRILGLIRDMAMAALFDRTITDAWTVAFRLPNLFRRLFGEGSLSLGFIPVFVDLREQDPTGVRARNLMNAFYACLLIFLGILTAWGLFFTEPILQALLDPFYTRHAEKYILTVKMARIMFGFVFFIVSYAYFMAILQALGEFKWPAFAPVVFNVAMITSIFLPQRWFPVPGEALAWGVLAGGILQAFVLIPILHGKNYFPEFRWKGMNEDLRKIFSRLLPALFGMGLLQIMTIINLHFASRLGEGVISSIHCP